MSTPTVRAKFMCSGKEGTTVFLHTVYSEDIQSEDRRFTKATPWGELWMNATIPTPPSSSSLASRITSTSRRPRDHTPRRRNR
ncbi:hypothetical protein [Sinorhizobium medicae]|uniref:hypothetical protein n=1 Tax=Sinorhizobium medicae TaxID=110321 RepID=UPI001F246985|nr:hypothetical protein [Sinorhizobium medicae]